MALTQVKQSAIVKIAVLIAILASLPKTIFLYEMISEGNLGFSTTWLLDLLYRLIFFFLSAWAILQLNANIGCQIQAIDQNTYGRAGVDQYCADVVGPFSVQISLSHYTECGNKEVA